MAKSKSQTYCVSVIVKIDAPSAQDAESWVRAYLRSTSTAAAVFSGIKETDVFDVEVCNDQDED